MQKERCNKERIGERASQHLLSPGSIAQFPAAGTIF
jgi:hypothetical protein